MKNFTRPVRLILIGMLLVFPLCNTNAQSWNWVKEERPLSDPSGYEHFIAPDDSGNVYATGNDWTPFGATISLAKYDPAGNFLWQSLPAANYNNGYSKTVAQSLGNEYLAGDFFSTIVFGNDTLRSSYYSMFLAKYDAGGTYLWSRQSKGTGLIHCESVAADRHGNVYVFGDCDGQIILGNDTFNTPPYQNVFLAKYDANGNYLWAKTGVVIKPNTNGYPWSVATDSAGDAIITGTYSGTLVFGIDTLPKTPFYVLDNAFVIKFSPSGSFLWQVAPKMPPRSGGSFGYCVSASPNGDVFLSGQYSSGTLTLGSIVLDSVSEIPFFAKINSNGSVSWAKRCYALDKYYWYGESIATDTLYNGYWLVSCNNNGFGHYNLAIGLDTFKLLTLNSTADVLVKFDTAGNVECGSIFTEGGEDDGDGMNISPSGKYVFVSGDIDAMGIFDKDTLRPDTEAFFLASWLPCGNVDTHTNEIKTNSEELKVYPNPNNGVFTITLSHPELVSGSQTIEIYNVMGERVKSEELRAKSEEVDMGAQPNGIYFYRVLAENGELVGSGKLIIQK